MNIIRDGILLIVYSFIIILAFVFTSEPFAQMVTGISSASDASMMTIVKNEVITVYGICCALAVLIPTIIFIVMAFTSRHEEYIW